MKYDQNIWYIIWIENRFSNFERKAHPLSIFDEYTRAWVWWVEPPWWLLHPTQGIRSARRQHGTWLPWPGKRGCRLVFWMPNSKKQTHQLNCIQWGRWCNWPPTANLEKSVLSIRWIGFYSPKRNIGGELWTSKKNFTCWVYDYYFSDCSDHDVMLIPFLSIFLLLSYANILVNYESWGSPNHQKFLLPLETRSKLSKSDCPQKMKEIKVSNIYFWGGTS